ncbi:IclR family transcriptional regulator [Bradyrhizobium elkanii]|jgi:DNA-binding IclR family transcriptional regulator|uniref:IclR family transcriptional regulator n=1 Tax=Bradyrhizobium elkanii TaxID=29448 RepID=UPI00216885CF|nr:IclR family transcriptional regulator [Bradyrhizobium elkanii]MCS3524231.1 DNA-binding IclR family transcriptional regulator [Bradyrhizobium elkanii]MCS4071887.1 DNA-binding IclR family transcriptional regulator [Bradyrhizobium elkanii]MCS4078519.1 DNA-binding IclR family transcriptional regulator [Bradyrhizobium elkanii]MCW2122897.1 DNA-binding IclR family transcriptional regulator [Bradyrhizobium elkanii]MCW2169644.1 DNA-binding IclR family transcriptional regulator [Bradyrhizobium elkani
MAKKSKAEVQDAEQGASGVRAVDRAIAILQCFTPDQPAMSVIEIQKRVGLSRPTLYRLLQTLAQRDLIQAEGDPQRFRLSHGVMKLAHVWLNGLEVVVIARRVVEGLREATGETAALFREQDDRGICILECESRHVLSISRGVGHSLSLIQGSTGKAMLAFMDPKRQGALLASIAKSADRARLEDALSFARRNGYATSHGEIFAGAVAVSAPCFDHRGEVVGSVGLYGPSARIDERKLLEYSKLVREAGRQISVLLGYQDGAPIA